MALHILWTSNNLLVVTRLSSHSYGFLEKGTCVISRWVVFIRAWSDKHGSVSPETSCSSRAAGVQQSRTQCGPGLSPHQYCENNRPGKYSGVQALETTFPFK
ncbi:unnamed protein product [Pleuronectes platessa]|uniref:Uncharacterized protein n=1 Tax=Pleuronectes platessa TaxID=8262 RepID=A0A9N7VHJ8_PLEPL|nr:unnamed protein product [Pleuronectes platessa]